MKKSDFMPDEKEIERRMRELLDDEDWDLLQKMEQDTLGLLSYNLSEMEREENENDEE